MCTDSDIRFLIIDPQGNEEMGVGNGVSRDVYMCDMNFSSMSGRPLLKFYIDRGYFAVIFSKAFVLHTLFKEVGVDDLSSSFFLYLSNDEANMLKSLLAEELGIHNFSSDEFYKFLEQFKVRSLVTKSNIKEKLAEVARQ